jgi:hypothetical protein
MTTLKKSTRIIFFVSLTILFINLINSEGIVNESSRDNSLTLDIKNSQQLKIYLEHPEDYTDFYYSNLNFSYFVYDKFQILNCTFKLYQRLQSFDVLKYSYNNYNVLNYQRIIIYIENLTSGDYTWIVECHDEDFNYNYGLRNFKIILNNSEDEDNSYNEITKLFKSIELLQLNLEEFLKRFNNKDFNFKKVISDLKIDETLSNYNQRLNELKHKVTELKYTKDSNYIINSRNEILKELLFIEKNIPKNIEIVEEREFFKQASKNNLVNLQSENYFTKINKGYETKTLTIFSTTKTIKIEYKDQSKIYILVDENINIEDTKDKLILLATEINSTFDIFLVSPNKIIEKNKLYEISLEKFNNKITYYLEDPKDLEKIKTIYFKEKKPTNSKITGYLIFEAKNLNYRILLIMIFIIIIVIIIFLIKWLLILKAIRKKETEEILGLINKTNLMIKSSNLKKARENYNNIKILYSNLQKEYKKYVYKKIKNISTRIDKRYIFNLVKEYYKAKSENRILDSKNLYNTIKESYKSLPEKYQLKIYNKMFKNSSENEP